MYLVEFIGKQHSELQTNFFSRYYDPNGNSGSGNEMMHELGFDTTRNFAAYSFRWRANRLDWWVNDYHLRTVHKHEGGPKIPDPAEIGMKIAANIWAVNKQAEEWAGPLDSKFYETSAQYKWIWHDPGENCNIQVSCDV